jgi:hypothetical protein
MSKCYNVIPLMFQLLASTAVFMCAKLHDTKAVALEDLLEFWLDPGSEEPLQIQLDQGIKFVLKYEYAFASVPLNNLGSGFRLFLPQSVYLPITVLFECVIAPTSCSRAATPCRNRACLPRAAP